MNVISRIAVMFYGPVIVAYLAIMGAVFGRREWFALWYRHQLQGWSIHALRALGINIEMDDKSRSNLEQTDNEIVLASHKSQLDSIVLWAVYPVRKALVFVAKKELFKVPMIGTGLKATGAISIDRKRGRGALNLLWEKTSQMGKDKSLVLYPEGTRSEGRALSGFKKGAFVIAKEAERNILPVCIIGTEELMPKHKWIPRRGKVTVRVLPPVPVASAREKSVEESMADVWKDMNAAMLQ